MKHIYCKHLYTELERVQSEREIEARFESMSFVVNILACKLKIVNNRN